MDHITLSEPLFPSEATTYPRINYWRSSLNTRGHRKSNYMGKALKTPLRIIYPDFKNNTAASINIGRSAVAPTLTSDRRSPPEVHPIADEFIGDIVIASIASLDYPIRRSSHRRYRHRHIGFPLLILWLRFVMRSQPSIQIRDPTIDA